MYRIALILALASFTITGCDDAKPATPVADAGATPPSAAQTSQAKNAKSATPASKTPSTKPVD